MKKITAIFALIGVLLQTFSPVAIVAAYYANKEAIARNLCENRDKPQMHCEGKCCLKKKLAKDSKEHAPGQRSQKSEQSVVLFFAHHSITIQHTLFDVAAQKFYSFNDLRTCSSLSSHFHPPGLMI